MQQKWCNVQCKESIQGIQTVPGVAVITFVMYFRVFCLDFTAARAQSRVAQGNVSRINCSLQIDSERRIRETLAQGIPLHRDEVGVLAKNISRPVHALGRPTTSGIQGTAPRTQAERAEGNHSFPKRV